MTTHISQNPFTVSTPEGLDAAVATQLFVDVFTDFYKIQDPGHSMLNGPRGSGKSMMFRYLEPDCQCMKHKCDVSELRFFAVLLSIKNTELNLTELRRLSGQHFNVVLNEHFLTTYVMSKVFSYIAELDFDVDHSDLEFVSLFAKSVYSDRLVRCGLARESVPAVDSNSFKEIFQQLGHFFDGLYGDVVQYARRLSLPRQDSPEFNGPLCGYLDFLHPVLQQMRQLKCMPDGPIYLMLDDADVLNATQTRILNSWMGTRTSSDVSLKVSTQNRYKTYAKVSGGIIESPHDFSEVNITDLYTTNRGKYLERIREIIRKRFVVAGIDSVPEEFFPCFVEQEERIAQIGEDIKQGKFEESGKGFRASDDVVRYARPIYMAGLAGKRKSSSKYMYAGFDQLVHISSGLIRYFLEPAALMFSEQQAKSNGPVHSIDPGIQNEEIRKMSARLLTAEFDKIVVDTEEHLVLADPTNADEDSEQIFKDKKRLLRNLIETLGGTFRQKLLSSDAERRVFSVAFTDGPQPDVEEIFEMGVKYGYFQKSTIGNKDGTGRTPLYILTRRLAPNFNLDPSGFAGYLFVTNERLREATQSPGKLLRRVKEKGVDTAFGEGRQLNLFDNGEGKE